jgi:translation initiation factor 2B subunit (eIF-2B alpha/beta/delta family)
MEDGEEPWETARRELQEETNLSLVDNASKDDDGPLCEMEPMGGLFLDVPFKPNRAIRVYPFVVKLLTADDPMNQLELRGTEHDTYRFISIPELEELEPAVPGLATAFHHATFGKYMSRDTLPESIWEWADDHVNGASTLARRAVPLALAKDYEPTKKPTFISYMTMLRPTMVPIVNVLKQLEQQILSIMDQQEENSASNAAKQASSVVLESFDQEVQRSIQMGAEALEQIFQESYNSRQSYNAQEGDDNKNASSVQQQEGRETFTIATFSRSSTILKIIQQFLTWRNPKNRSDGSAAAKIEEVHILCAKSTPGDEGVLMAQDLRATAAASANNNVVPVQVECLEDESLHQAIREGRVKVVVVGSDCVMDTVIVNKKCTKALAETCRQSSSSTTTKTTTPIICCADRFKLWEDIFPPPLEDIFECVPRSLFQQVLVPPLLLQQQHSSKDDKVGNTRS